MERLYLEIPSIKRKQDAYDYINEFYHYNSKINGVSELHRYLNDYEGWLEKLEEDYITIPNEERVPARTYFLVRENDDRIIGMINIRIVLNERLKKHGGHIGYSIRPTERRKGYNKINLYLGLEVCKEYNISEVIMDCNKDNIASSSTMKALGGVLTDEYQDNDCIMQKYKIDVNKSLEKYKEIYKN